MLSKSIWKVNRRDLRPAWLALWISVLLFLGVGSALQIHAQTSTGLTGTVTDPSGAAITGVQVNFTNEATGVITQFGTTSEGSYTANLSPGSYDVTVEAPGFATFKATHVVVEIGATPTFNIKMKLGASNQTVQVSSVGALELNTTNPQLDTILPTSEVSDLPILINGYMRQITSFATLAPGVRSGPYGSVTVEGGASGQINSAGNYFNGLQIDTASDINSDPPYEMVDQFRVIRNTFSARFGMVQGAVDYNMRSGTNQLHGDGFLIDRNSFFDSDGFFPVYNAAGKPIPPKDIQTDWGGTVGGPVFLPHIYNGHNRTFFLASFDLFNWNQGQANFGSVPTQAEVGGDFSHFVDSNGNLIPIYDPQTGKQFMGCNGNQPNVICPTRFDPLSASLLKYIPAPNAAGTNYGLQNNEAPAVNSISIQNRAWGLTLNHQISPSQNIAVTWWRNHYFTPQIEESGAAAIVPANNPLSGMEDLTDNANIWLVNYSKAISPNLVMTAGLSAQQKWQNNVNANQDVNFAGVAGGTTMPHISFNGQEAPTGWGNYNSDIVHYHVNNVGWNLFNNWTWNKGKHTLNFGGEFHHYYASVLNNYSGGQFSFSQAETSIPDTTDPNFSKWGSSFASFLLGLPDSAARTASTTVAINTNAFAAYLQDDYKVTQKLTLNLGLRYDLMMPYTMSRNDDVFLAAATPNPAAGNLPGAATEYGNCVGCAGFNQLAMHNLYFGPRVGFAYSLNRNTVIQAGYYLTALGYGGAYGQGEGAYGGPTNMTSLLGGSYTLNSTGGNTSAYGPWTSAATGAANPIPVVSPTPFSPGLGVAQTIYYVDYQKNGEAPLLQMWTLSVQRQLPWHIMLTTDYTANRVTHMSGYNLNPISQPNPSVLAYGALLTDNINSSAAQAAGFTAPYADFSSQFGGGATVYQSLKPFPQYSNVARAWDQSATTYFSAFQVQADKHLSNNLNFLANVELPRLYDNFSTAENKYNQRPEWAEDSTGSFESKFAGTYELPFGLGHRWLNSGNTAKYLGGWQIAAILTYNNSQPLAITQSGESFMNGLNRPNINPYVTMWSGNYKSIPRYFEGKGPAPLLFSTNAWSPTGSQYVLGNAKRAYNQVRGPWYPVEDLSAKKSFHFTEGTYLTLRMDYFNAFNRTQAPWPSTDINSSSFGQVTTKFSSANRQGQAQVTLNF